jgi:hypothetical protein
MAQPWSGSGGACHPHINSTHSQCSHSYSIISTIREWWGWGVHPVKSQTTSHKHKKLLSESLLEFLQKNKKEETLEGLLEEFKVQEKTEPPPTREICMTKSEIAAGADLVIFLQVLPGNSTLKLLHSIGNSMVGLGTNDRYHNKCIGFVGDRDGLNNPTSMLVMSNVWEWQIMKNTPADLTKIRAHFVDPSNRLNIFLFPIPHSPPQQHQV